MIINETGIELTPGNLGNNCLANGEHTDEAGNPIECCCDNCDYMMCCLENHDTTECETCSDNRCPHAKGPISFTSQNSLYETQYKYDTAFPVHPVIYELINLRKSNKLTQRELAKKLRINEDIIYDFENGNIIPNFKFLSLLAQIYGMDIDIKLIQKNNRSL